MEPRKVISKSVSLLSMDSNASRSLVLAAAGLAAAISVAGLQLTRSSYTTAERKREPKDPNEIEVGLLKLHSPRDWQDTIKNDVYLDKTIGMVTRQLYIYVSGSSRHDIIMYVGELYNLAWDVACIKGKPNLDVRIVGALPHDGVPKWEQLVSLSEIDAVFAADESDTEDQVNGNRVGLPPVKFISLASVATPFFHPEFHYFENRKTNLDGHEAVLLGGTFDHLHNGHKKLLALAVSICKNRLIIGITSEEMLRKKKNATLIESLETRQRKVRGYVGFLKSSLRVEFAVLSDAYGPAIEVPDADAALVVSTETVAAVHTIQDMRVSRELPPLQIYICRRTDGSTLSSSYIRAQIAARKSRPLP